jgi:hypothetical protein
VGCAATRDRAIAIAEGEVAHRKLPLPKSHTVDVSERVVALEVEPSYRIWRIEFRVSGRKDPLYSVSVDQRNGIVEDSLIIGSRIYALFKA